MKLIVFDIDGTLTDTKSIDDLCFIDSVKECWDCKLQDVDWSIYKNVTDTGLAKDIYFNFFKEELQEAELLKLKKKHLLARSINHCKINLKPLKK